ncbi:hypothetical protein [Streptomyces sp. NPDC093589]|uniref:hypothetical protein n=1 Tax=Streptomyces sp. NPDC093589 TaxID=3366043 RepID=UPI00381B3355
MATKGTKGTKHHSTKRPLNGRADHQLTHADAIRHRAALLDWFATDYLIHAFVAGLPSHGARLWPDQWSHASFEDRVALYRNEGMVPASRWREAAVVYADPAMCDLVTAAAQTFPEQPVQRHEFLAPTGFLFFAKPIPATALAFPGSTDELPISAITWACVDDGLSSIAYTLRSAGVYDVGGVRIPFPALHPSRPYDLLWDSPAERGMHNVSMLRALSALSKQPLAREDSPKIHQSVRGIARRSGIHPKQFRRISLRRPEIASFELAAARAVAEGCTPAGHWVRGHWREQYYATVDEHRPIWVEGFPRGDFTKSAPTGQKLLIAHGDRPTAAAT